MSFDWTTFFLEIVNFLVLVWLLHRFFYRPVLGVVEARRAESLKMLEEAARRQQEADRALTDYREKVAAWEKERAAAWVRLDDELAREREARLKALDKTLAAERERREALDAKSRETRERELEARAVRAAATFAARFLDRLAGPELENRLVDLALEELERRGAELAQRLRPVLAEAGARVRVVTVHPLDEVRRAAFTRALTDLAGKRIEPVFEEDSTLKAGVSMMAGSWVLAANLRDELGFFAQVAAGEESHGTD